MSARTVRMVVLLVALLLPGLGSVVQAHPLDEANIYHFSKCDLTAEGLTLDYRLLVGGLAVYKTWDALDTDKNKVLSAEEKQAFAKRTQDALRATLDEKTVSLTLVSCDLPNYQDFITGTAPYLKLVLKTTWGKLRPGARSFDFKTNAFPEQSNLYIRPVVEGPAAKGATASTVAGQKGFTLRFLLPQTSAVAPAVSAPSLEGDPGRSKQRPDIIHAVSPNARVAVGDKSPAGNKPLPNKEGAGSTSAQKMESEGHGIERSGAMEETLSNTRPAGSPALPVVTTDSEPGSAALNFRMTPTAVSQERAAPPPPSRALQILRPFLTGKGGVLVALGFALLLGMGHALLPGHSKTIVGAYLIGARGTVRDAVLLGSVVTLAHTGVVFLFGLLMWRFERFAPEKIQPALQVASGLLVAGLGFGLLIRGLRRWQGRNAEVTEAVSDAFAFVPRAGTTKRDLILLGLSGGMVPCVDALILLLFAHAQQKTAFGLLLVLAFGVGMAAVLVGIGLVMVKAGGTLARWQNPRLERLAHAVPLLSATLICSLGLYLVGSALVQNLQK